MAETMDTLLAGYLAASDADRPGWLQRMNERVAAIQENRAQGQTPRRMWYQDDTVMVREPDGTIHPAAMDDPDAMVHRMLMGYSHPPTEPPDLGTFIGVIGAFEEAGIDVRHSYWDDDDRAFVIVLDGKEHRVASVAVVDDRIVVTVE